MYPFRQTISCTLMHFQVVLKRCFTHTFKTCKFPLSLMLKQPIFKENLSKLMSNFLSKVIIRIYGKKYFAFTRRNSYDISLSSQSNPNPNPNPNPIYPIYPILPYLSYPILSYPILSNPIYPILSIVERVINLTVKAEK